jgi:hypothetical protein
MIIMSHFPFEGDERDGLKEEGQTASQLHCSALILKEKRRGGGTTSGTSIS